MTRFPIARSLVPFAPLVALGIAFLAGPTLAQEGAAPLRALGTADDARGWEAIGRLDTGVSFCTATLIAPDLVLTAAHCLYDDVGQRIVDADLQFAASLRHGRAEAYRGVARSFVHPDYDGPNRDETPGAGVDALMRDVALLELDRAIPVQTVAALTLGTAGRVRDLVTVVSYGEDRERFASIEEDCAILAEEDNVQVLSCNVVAGSSGAPILRVEEGGVSVIAVMSARAEWRGETVAVAVSLDEIVAELRALRTRPTIRMPQGIRRLTLGDDGRDSIGARFITP